MAGTSMQRNVNPGLVVGEVASETQAMLDNFWPKVIEEINNVNVTNDFKSQDLPLARIKKIMKLDEDVKMISAEAPVLFAKACEIFVSELSLRAWIHTEENKRRTLQKNDVSQAVAKYDQFDFLIDIVPRDEIKPAKREEHMRSAMTMPADQVQYLLQLAQQPGQSFQQQGVAAALGSQPITITPSANLTGFQNQTVQLQGGQVVGGQVVSSNMLGQQGVVLSQAAVTTSGVTDHVGVGQTTDLTQHVEAVQEEDPEQQQGTQVFQQVVLPGGEVVNMPVQLTQAQLQAIQAQMVGKQPGQPIVIQANLPSTDNVQPVYQLGGDDAQIYLDTDDMESGISAKEEH